MDANGSLVAFWWLAAVGRTAAFSFAGILAFAAVVAGFATAFAFAGVLSFAGMNVFLVFVAHLAERDARFGGHVGGVRLDGERATHQSGDSCAGEDCFRFHISLSVWLFTRTRKFLEPIEAEPNKIVMRRDNLCALCTPPSEEIADKVFPTPANYPPSNCYALKRPPDSSARGYRSGMIALRVAERGASERRVTPSPRCSTPNFRQSSLRSTG
jgi:hypothetical protein